MDEALGRHCNALKFAGNMWIKITYLEDMFCGRMKRRFSCCSVIMMRSIFGEKNKRGQLSEKHHSYSEAWWWVGSVTGLFFYVQVRFTG